MAITRKSHLNNLKTTYKGVGFWSMPHMESAVMLEEHSTSNIAKTNPIFKINVPGYLMYYTYNNNAEIDYYILASDKATSLVGKTSVTSASNYVIALLNIVTDGTDYGKNIITPIVPGKNTYIRLIRQNEVQKYSEFFFIPCRGVTSYGLKIASNRWYTKTSYSGDGSIIASACNPVLGRYGSECFNKVFQGDWMDNFTDIDFSKILDLRESHMSFFLDYKEVA